jgi:acyl-coenzyme A synthetase/AMP-(fatty) acid ligase
MHYRGYTISYGEFAYWISLAREFLAGQDLRPGNVAAFVRVPNMLDAWALRLALNSLGLITVDVADAETLLGLEIRNIGCVVTTIHDQPIEIPDAGYKLLSIPDPLFLGKQAKGVPEMPPMNVPVGGHILLTSGTTGYRKKVLCDAAAISNERKHQCKVLSISEHSVVHALDFSPWAGAGYRWPIAAWSVGGAVVCHQGRNLLRSFEIERITHAVVTPMKLEELLATPQGNIRFHPEMRLFVTGAPMTAALAAAAKSRLTPNVMNMLSCTEGGVLALTRIEGPEDLKSQVLVIGADVQIVDDVGKPLPAGQVGAMRVRIIEGLTGYLDDDASRQSFRDGYFYTGDLGEMRADGRLVLHGRVSNVINFGGEKRPVETIEQQMQDRLGVDGICLLSLQMPSLEEEIHMFVQSQRALDRVELLDALVRVALLPGYPSVQIHHVDMIPRNEMGKIDRPAVRQKISAMSSRSAD